MRPASRIACHCIFAIVALWACIAFDATARSGTSRSELALSALPAEAQQTVERIRAGGPFPYARDGAVFGNYERRLPTRASDYYREYTVRTPGAHDRGARRIIAGAGGELYYTDDHYRTFRRVRE